jgi:hypothetical protein
VTPARAAVVAAVVAWCCVLAASPGTPAGVSEEATLVWSRHCGARDRLVVIAIVLTALALVLLVMVASGEATIYRTVPACTENMTAKGVC